MQVKRFNPGPVPSGVYALCDAGVRPDLPMEEKARLLLEGGAKVLQVRMKSATATELLEVLRRVLPLCRARDALCLVNDRVDLALVSGADGVHLGADDLPVREARRVLGPAAVVGATVRGTQDALDAARAGASYVGLGPIFATSTKQVGRDPLGLAALRSVVEQCPVPVVAIAGIGLHNLAEVAQAGAHAAAMASALFEAPDVPARVRALSQCFAGAA